MKKTLKVSRQEAAQVEAQEKFVFIRDTLSKINLPLDGCFPDSNKQEDFTVPHKIKLRQVLRTWNISIVDMDDGETAIYNEKVQPKHLIAKWNQVVSELKEDLSAAPRDRLHLLLYIDYWTEFEK